MDVRSVACNNCGAPLEVAPATNFVTCKHCGSRLAIKRTGSSLYTELLEKLDRRTEGMSDQLAEIAYRAELERIDREWEEERGQYLIRDKQGNAHEPNVLGSRISGAIAMGFGLIWTFAACSMTGLISQDSPAGNGPGGIIYLFPLVGLGIIGFGVYLIVQGPKKARQFENARAAYQRRRQSVTVDQFRPQDEPR